MSDQPTIDQVNLVVRDMDASAAFYRLLGVAIPEADGPFGPHHRSASLAGGIDLDLDSEQFASRWNSGWQGGRSVMGFKVASREEVDARHATLTGAGYRSQQAPYDAFWGARYAIVEDPDGNAVGIMSPVDPTRRSAPPDP